MQENIIGFKTCNVQIFEKYIIVKFWKLLFLNWLDSKCTRGSTLNFTSGYKCVGGSVCVGGRAWKKKSYCTKMSINMRKQALYDIDYIYCMKSKINNSMTSWWRHYDVINIYEIVLGYYSGLPNLQVGVKNTRSRVVAK